MRHRVDALLSVRAGPRPDPLRIRSGPPWTRLIPAATAAVACATALAALAPRDLGLLACGAAAWAVASGAVRGDLRAFALRLHLAAGLLALAIFRGADAAGSFAPAAAVLLVAELAASGAAQGARVSVAPMAGSVPWRFRARYRQLALRYGLVGFGLALMLVLFVPDPVVKVIGVACLPMALRSFGLQLLPPQSAGLLWVLLAFFHVAALAAFVPAFGAIAAAWIVVVAETLLLVAVGSLIARRTGVANFPVQAYTIGSAAALLLFALAIPDAGVWPVLVAVVGGAAATVLFGARRFA